MATGKRGVKHPIRVALLRLLFFTVLPAVVALIIVGVILHHRRGDQFDVTEVWRRGELALIALAVVADGIGSMFPGGKGLEASRTAIGGFSLLVTFVAAAWFVLAQAFDDFEPTLNTIGSFSIFGFGILTAAFAKSLEARP